MECNYVLTLRSYIVHAEIINTAEQLLLTLLERIITSTGKHMIRVQHVDQWNRTLLANKPISNNCTMDKIGTSFRITREQSHAISNEFKLNDSPPPDCDSSKQLLVGYHGRLDKHIRMDVWTSEIPMTMPFEVLSQFKS